MLIGFTGTGKTEVGRILSKKLGRRFFDINEIIEKKEKDKIVRVSQIKGEKYLQEIEERIIGKISQENDCIIATRVNTVLSDKNYKNLKRNGLIICLTAEPSIIILRSTPTKHSSVLLKSKDAIKIIRETLKEKQPYYSKADYTIDTSDFTVEQVADKILELIKGEGKCG